MSQRSIMVRYRVKPERADENERLVKAVYEELARARPDGFHYATFRLEDGVTFVHMAVEDAEGAAPLGSLEAFQRFREGLGERCDEPPTSTGMSEVGSYMAFAG